MSKGDNLNSGFFYSKKSHDVINYSDLKNDILSFNLTTPIAIKNDYFIYAIDPETINGNELFENLEYGQMTTTKQNIILVMIKISF